MIEHTRFLWIFGGLQESIWRQSLEAKVLTKQWRREYNVNEFYGAPGYRSPAPEKMNIAEYKSFSNSIISPTERAKDNLRKSINFYQNNYPDRIKENDARWAWFTGAKKVLQTAQLSYIYIRDQLSDPNWWKSKALGFKEEEIAAHIKEYDVFIRVGVSNTIFTITEETLRSIVITIDCKACKRGRGSFKSIYDYLFKHIGDSKYDTLFDFHRLIRNTIHTNGIYLPENNKDVALNLFGTTFKFTVGEKVAFLTMGNLLSLISAYNTALFEIFENAKIQSIDYVKRLF